MKYQAAGNFTFLDLSKKLLKSYYFSLFVASITCLFSLLCAIILLILDRRRSKIIPSEPVKAGDEIKLSDGKLLIN